MEIQENMIQTAIKAAQKPFIITAPNGMPIIANPCGNDTDWAYAKDETLLDKPLHKKGQPEFHDAKSLIKFVTKHKQEGTQIFIDADYKAGKINIIAIINGHTAVQADWGDFVAFFRPVQTTSAENWLKNNVHKMNQAEFAHFLTNNARNIVSQNPAKPEATYPTAAEVLDFALNLEYTETTTFKQGYREQDGRINFTFTSKDDAATEKNLKMFERFGISFTPYQGGEPYFVEALLKFRIEKNTGALCLWYELQQIDAVIEQAAQDIAEEIQKSLADVDIYFGRPD